MGRPRTPKALAKDLAGDKKNPKRRHEREREPQAAAGIGEPPEEWCEHHPKLKRAAELYGQGCTVAHVMTRIGVDFETALALKPGLDNEFDRACRMRASWRKIQRWATWLDAANGIVVERLCEAIEDLRQARLQKKKNVAQLYENVRGLMTDLGLSQAARGKVIRGVDGGVESDPSAVRMSLEIDL